MWCPDCQEEFPIVVGSEVQVCPKCRAASSKGRLRRRVPHLHPGAERTARIRINGPHESGRTADPGGADRLRKPLFRFPLSRSPIHLVIFGLFVFLVGQSILAWAFLTGHFLAWSVANLITVFGMVIALLSVASTLRNFERRFNALQDVSLRSHRGRNRRKHVGGTRKRS